jgi:hypothetical protein
MRWSELLDMLPPATAAALVNGLTVGYGMTALAGQHAARADTVAAVERTVAAAHDALGRTLQLLPAALRPAPAGRRVPDEPTLPPQTWTAYLLELPGDAGQVVHGRLRAAVGLAQRSGEAVLADGDAAGIIAEVEAAQAALAAAHDVLRRRATERD